MADDDENRTDVPPNKKLKIKIQLDAGTRALLSSAVRTLMCNPIDSLVPLKIIYCDAKEPTAFSQAVCVLKRSTEVKDPKQFEVYAFGSIFQRGIGHLETFLANPTNLPADQRAVVALSRLVNFLDVSESIAAKLSRTLTQGRKSETSWSIQLVHHLLKELFVNQLYVIDSDSKFKDDYCRCCREEITGHYGDTSIGHEKVWHGSVDILMGHGSVAVKVDNEDEGCIETSFEIEDEAQEIEHHEEQIVPEAIVFAFLQRKVHYHEFDYFLIPTLSVSGKHVMFYFYDPAHDILLQSWRPLPLFKDDSTFFTHTVLALWLAINYQYFSSGITDQMLDRNFRADFLKSLNKTQRDIYKEDLRFGNCKNRPRMRDGLDVDSALSVACGKPLPPEAKSCAKTVLNSDS